MFENLLLLLRDYLRSLVDILFHRHVHKADCTVWSIHNQWFADVKYIFRKLRIVIEHKILIVQSDAIPYFEFLNRPLGANNPLQYTFCLLAALCMRLTLKVSQNAVISMVTLTRARTDLPRLTNILSNPSGIPSTALAFP